MRFRVRCTCELEKDSLRYVLVYGALDGSGNAVWLHYWYLGLRNLTVRNGSRSRSLSGIVALRGSFRDETCNILFGKVRYEISYGQTRKKSILSSIYSELIRVSGLKWLKSSSTRISNRRSLTYKKFHMPWTEINLNALTRCHKRRDSSRKQKNRRSNQKKSTKVKD